MLRLKKASEGVTHHGNPTKRHLSFPKPSTFTFAHIKRNSGMLHTASPAVCRSNYCSSLEGARS